MIINMENEFIPYELALALKELGFDEPCFCYWYTQQGSFPSIRTKDIQFNGWKNYPDSNTVAPLYQQAFRWFREVHKINPQIAFCEYSIESENSWKFTFDNPTKRQFWQGEFDNYEEAELECLKKLIEITKNGK